MVVPLVRCESFLGGWRPLFSGKPEKMAMYQTTISKWHAKNRGRLKALKTSNKKILQREKDSPGLNIWEGP
jgi:hypothetical protein